MPDLRLVICHIVRVFLSSKTVTGRTIVLTSARGHINLGIVIALVRLLILLFVHDCFLLLLLDLLTHEALLAGLYSIMGGGYHRLLDDFRRRQACIELRN